MPEKNEPLDLEEIADEIIRTEYKGHYEQLKTISQLKSSVNSRKFIIKRTLEQQIKSAVQGLKEDVEKHLLDQEEYILLRSIHIPDRKIQDKLDRIMDKVYILTKNGFENKIKKWFPNNWRG